MQPNINPLQLTQAQLDANKLALAKSQTSNDSSNFFADAIDNIGSFLRLPEIGISESLAGGNPTTNTANPVGVDITKSPLALGLGTTTPYDLARSKLVTNQTGNNQGDQVSEPQLVGYDINGDPVYSNSSNGNTGGAFTSTDEVASYDDQISNLNRLLGFAGTKKQQGIQSIEDQYNSTKGVQEQTFNKQRLQNTQNQEKGYGEVGNFANTSMNNFNRLLQGANAGRSSVGQVLAPFMVGRSADTRRKSVTDTAGENAANIDLTADTTFQELGNQRKKNLQDYEASVIGTQNDLEGQKRQAMISRGLASGQGYGQAKAGASALDASMNDRYAQLTDLFNKYKPDYSVKEAPALSTYQVDPAQIKSQGQGTSDFYLNMLKRKKDIQGV